MTAAERWREAMAAWAVPQDIIAAAPESPWGFPTELFKNRAHTALAQPRTESHRRALERLPEGGTVLDVGVGGGAASLPLAPQATVITGVDSSAGMLKSFREAAAAAGVGVRTVSGDWPDAAARVEQSDVVVCQHVFFNVGELEPFVAALASRAKYRVVVEMTPEHPLAWMSDLWATFHNLKRPDCPGYADAVEVVSGLGFDVSTELTEGPPVMSGFASRADAIALVRKRLCLWPADDERLADALGNRLSEQAGLWSAAPRNHTLATLWWDVDQRGP
ncbi:MAG: class I SAM-dependent methyltransferase [Actinomycetota bacterium]